MRLPRTRQGSARGSLPEPKSLLNLNFQFFPFHKSSRCEVYLPPIPSAAPCEPSQSRTRVIPKSPWSMEHL